MSVAQNPSVTKNIQRRKEEVYMEAMRDQYHSSFEKLADDARQNIIDLLNEIPQTSLDVLHVFPFISPDGSPFSNFDSKYLEALEGVSPEKLESVRRAVSELSSLLDGNGIEFKSSGQAVKYLSRVSQFNEDNPVRNAVISQLNQNLFETLKYSFKRGDLSTEKPYSLPEKEQLLQTLFESANEMYHQFKNGVYGLNSDEFFGQLNEVEAENNPGKLIMIMMNPSLDPRMRFEALRKLIIARELSRIHLKSGKSDFLNYFQRNLDRSNLFVKKEGSASPKLTKTYLVSRHNDPQSLISEDAKFLDHYPDKLAENENVIELQVRSFINRSGEEKKIFFSSREKSALSQFIKGLRDQNINYDNFEDTFGVMVVAENIDDLGDFQMQLEAALRKQKCSVFSTKVKNNLEGNLSATGGQSKSYRDRKNKFQILFPKKADELGQVYQREEKGYVEMIGMTTEMYVNSKFSDAAHDLYKINRVFKKNINQMMNPVSLYGYDHLNEWLGMLMETIDQIKIQSPALKRQFKNHQVNRFLNDRYEDLIEKGVQPIQAEKAIHNLAKGKGINFTVNEQCPALQDFHEASLALQESVYAFGQAISHLTKGVRSGLMQLIKKV